LNLGQKNGNYRNESTAFLFSLIETRARHIIADSESLNTNGVESKAQGLGQPYSPDSGFQLLAIGHRYSRFYCKYRITQAIYSMYLFGGKSVL
jgi:hypothetical protein